MVRTALMMRNMKLSPEFNKYHNIWAKLLHPETFSGRFVHSPTVKLLTYAECEHPDTMAAFFVTGIPIETTLEFIAHKEASVSRLTSSKTRAMNDDMCMYRVFANVHGKDESIEWQENLIMKNLDLREEIRRTTKNLHIDLPNEEIFNMFNIGAKIGAFVYKMKLADYHKLFIGRTNFEGNESDVRDVVSKMNNILHNLYPNIIHPSDIYTKMTNFDKTKTMPQFNICDGVYKTKLTKDAVDMFSKVNINLNMLDYFQLAEFESRLTYLSFLNEIPSPEKSEKYLRKLLCELGHLSILSGFEKYIFKNNRIEIVNLKKIWSEKPDKTTLEINF
jgi:hypothetical protein